MSNEDESDIDRASRLLLQEWQALGIEEQDGDLYFPTTIKRRKADGSLDEIPIRLKRLDNNQRILSRIRSRQRAVELKLDAEKDGDLIAELERYEELAFAIRDPKPPYDQFRMSSKQLFEEFRAQELITVYGELDAFTQRCDPRLHELSHEQQWKVIEEVARRGDTTPLMHIDGPGQLSCIIFSAKAAMLSPIAPSQSPSSSTFTADS